jgi:hypothetical protein
VPTWTKPVTLTANTNENVNDLNAILDDIYARANGGLDETNVPNLTAAFTSYKVVERGGANLASPAGSYVLGTAASGPMNSVSPATAGSASASFTFDPALYVANSRQTKLNLRVVVTTNTVASGQTFTTNMYPLSGFGGASGSAPSIVTAAAVSGSTVTITTPAASSAVLANSGDFNAPAVAQFVIATVITGAPTGGTAYHVQYQLLMRQV